MQRLHSPSHFYSFRKQKILKISTDILLQRNKEMIRRSIPLKNLHFFKINSKVYIPFQRYPIQGIHMCGKNVNQFKRSKNKINEKKIEMAFHAIRHFQDWENVFCNFTHLHLRSVGCIINLSNDFYLQSNAFTCSLIWLS